MNLLKICFVLNLRNHNNQTINNPSNSLIKTSSIFAVCPHNTLYDVYWNIKFCGHAPWSEIIEIHTNAFFESTMIFNENSVENIKCFKRMK